MTVNGTTTAITGAVAKTANGDPMGFDITIEVLSIGANTVISYAGMVGGAWTEAQRTLTGGNLSTHNLKIDVEYWTADAANPVNARVVRIVPQKRGTKRLPLR